MCGPPEKEDILSRMSAPRKFDPGCSHCAAFRAMHYLSCENDEGGQMEHTPGKGTGKGADAYRSAVKNHSRVLLVTLDQG